MKQPIDLEGIRAVYKAARHALAEKDHTHEAMTCIGSAVGQIPALLDAHTEQAAKIVMLRKMQPVDFKGDAANQLVLAMELAEAKAEIARLEGLVEMYQALRVCPGCHALDINADGHCDCGDKAIPINEWLRIWRGFSEREGG
jgi:hypothetical protein